VPTLPFPDAPREVETVGAKLRVVPVVSALENPWSLTWLPNGKGFFTVDGDRLLFVTLDGASRVLWSPAGFEPWWAEPSPDSKHLAIHMGSGQVNAWMLSGL